MSYYKTFISLSAFCDNTSKVVISYPSRYLDTVIAIIDKTLKTPSVRFQVGYIAD